MSNSKFVSVDTAKIADFERQSEEVISEFAAIKEQFKKINGELLDAWDGSGAGAYKFETDHILEKIGGVESVLNSINESAVKDIRSIYSDLDEQLGAFNKNPYSEEGEE